MRYRYKFYSAYESAGEKQKKKKLYWKSPKPTQTRKGRGKEINPVTHQTIRARKENTIYPGEIFQHFHTEFCSVRLPRYRSIYLQLNEGTQSCAWWLHELPSGGNGRLQASLLLRSHGKRPALLLARSLVCFLPPWLPLARRSKD